MFNILDCTLRDGGYYNNWDFPCDVVDNYLQAVSKAGIDYVELGFRNFPKEEFLGAFAYTTESFLETIELPLGPKYGVMIDAKVVLSSDLTIDEAIEFLFVEKRNSPIDFVRIAAHFKEVPECEQIVRKLKSLGYFVGLNLMQSGGKESSVICEAAMMIESWGCVDVLYFADSLGNMNDEEVRRIILALKMHWTGSIGIHTHNNMGKGLDNTLVALREGVTWLDSTVTGMGRGAGNTATENLLATLEKERSYSYKAKPVYELVIRDFEPMQKKYGWGTNLLYFLGAQNSVHPTYIQNLLSNPHYGTDEIVGAIDYLSELETSAIYDGAVLENALSFNSEGNYPSGNELTANIFSGENVLLIANAPATKKYKKAIETYIRQVKPLVLSLNIVEAIDTSLIDYYVISHNSKFLADMHKYVVLKKPIILPKHRFSADELKSIEFLDILDFGLQIEKQQLSFNDCFAVVPFDITAAYILAILLKGEPKSVSLVGFDGYDSFDTRQQEMLDILNLYQSHKNSVELISLTPTSYALKQSSIYAPVTVNDQ